MAIDVTALQASQEQHAEAIAHLQRAIELLAQQQALHAQALLHAIQGKWDAAQFGPESAEAVLVALNPALQGKVDAVPFEGRRQLEAVHA
jgi:hypothetical protein